MYDKGHKKGEHRLARNAKKSQKDYISSRQSSDLHLLKSDIILSLARVIILRLSFTIATAPTIARMPTAIIKHGWVPLGSLLLKNIMLPFHFFYLSTHNKKYVSAHKKGAVSNVKFETASLSGIGRSLQGASFATEGVATYAESLANGGRKRP